MCSSGLEPGLATANNTTESVSPKPSRKVTRMPSVPVNVLLNIKSALTAHLTQLLVRLIHGFFFLVLQIVSGTLYLIVYVVAGLDCGKK